MTIKIIRKKITKAELEKIAKESLGDEMVKATVDIKREILTLGGGLHADGESLLLKDGSKQENIWGINIYPARSKDKRIEYFALINIRPLLGNRSMKIQNPKIKEKIRKIVDKLIE